MLDFGDYILIFLIALVVFLVIDLAWLGVVARGVYNRYLGKLTSRSPFWPAAFTFYTLFVIGLLYFAVVPAINDDSLRDAVQNGALYGFFTYVTYDLTNYAVLKGWPKEIVPIDIAWGTVLALSVSTITYWIYTGVFL